MTFGEWRTITNKFAGKCLECSETIYPGETILWSKGFGIKHQDCVEGFSEDNSRLIIHETDEEFYLK